MKKCPVCNEPLPLLSKVCPVCGYVVENGESPSAEEMANSLEYILHDMKSIPVPSFASGMSKLSAFILPIISAFLLIMAWISSAGLFWILFLLTFIGSFIIILKKLKGKLKVDIAQRKIKELKNDYELTARIAKRDFGENREVNRLLKDVSAQIHEIEEKWNGAMRKNFFIWMGILLVIIILFATGTCSVNSIVEKTESTETSAGGNWRQEIERFLLLSEEEQNDPELRLHIVKGIIEAGEMEEAEKFFINNLMGKLGDMECAKEIVNAYIVNGQKDKAVAFSEKCVAMRYNSDVDKLKQLIK